MVVINLVLQLCYYTEMLFYIILLLCSSCAGITSAITSYIYHKILSLVYISMCVFVSLFALKHMGKTCPNKEHKESK